MSGETWTVNSDHSLLAYIADVKQRYAKHKYLTYPAPRIGADRSITQNSLFHVWLTAWIAHKLEKPPRQVDPAELAGIKRTVKKLFYMAHPDADWMVHEIKDYSTGQVRKDYTSSADWKIGEMYQVLDFTQMQAANDGLILEAKGQYAKLKREHG